MMTSTGLIAALVFVVAVLYSSVGFGGASSYLAVMSMFNISPSLSASLALTLNILVASITFTNYARQRHFRWNLLWPFLVGSVPAAFIGGTIKLGSTLYEILLNLILVYVALRLFFMPKIPNSETNGSRHPGIRVALAVGAGLGFVSGMIGIGGGIFLSPIIVLTKWGTAKEAASSSAGFIVINSISGLLGRAAGGTLEYTTVSLLFILVGVIGGFIGSYVGAKYLSTRTVQVLLGVVLLIVVGRNILA